MIRRTRRRKETALLHGQPVTSSVVRSSSKETNVARSRTRRPRRIALAATESPARSASRSAALYDSALWSSLPSRPLGAARVRTNTPPHTRIGPRGTYPRALRASDPAVWIARVCGIRLVRRLGQPTDGVEAYYGATRSKCLRRSSRSRSRRRRSSSAAARSARPRTSAQAVFSRQSSRAVERPLSRRARCHAEVNSQRSTAETPRWFARSRVRSLFGLLEPRTSR